MAYAKTKHISGELNTMGVKQVLSPCIDVARELRWGRVEESFGEDPFLCSAMAVAEVRGYLDHGISPMLKHYGPHGNPSGGLNLASVDCGVRDLFDIYLKPFETVLAQTRVMAVMSSYNAWNRVPNSASHFMLTEILRNKFGFRGYVYSDWGVVAMLKSFHKTAGDDFEAARQALEAGLDVEASSPCFETLAKQVKNGNFDIRYINQAVKRVLRAKFGSGLFEDPFQEKASYHLPLRAKESIQLSRQIADESTVLLKNEGNILPLAKGKKILLAGPNANSMRCLNGGWSYSWQGHRADDCAQAYNTIYEALCNKYGKENIIYEPGVTYAPYKNDNWWEENAPEIEKSVAAQADVIIACVGENSYCETPGNMNDLTMSTNQRNLVKALAATGKPVVLVLNQGRPRIINDIEPLAKAVVNVMLPGNYGGDALANLLAGDANFSAKMPFTYPKYINSLATYDYKPCENIGQMGGNYNYDAVMDVQWPFGFGLSYTTYNYSNLKVDKSQFTADDELVFTVDVTNTGKVAGKESVLLFSKDMVASSTPDNIRLRNFEKIELQPGETQTVTLKLKGSDLAFVGYDGKWRLEQGDFKVKCGDQWIDLQCTATKIWDTPNR